MTVDETRLGLILKLSHELAVIKMKLVWGEIRLITDVCECVQHDSWVCCLLLELDWSGALLQSVPGALTHPGSQWNTLLNH